MVVRDFWIARLRQVWERAPIAWLAGVRRVGKTTLVRSLPEADCLYLNCDSPRTALDADLGNLRASRQAYPHGRNFLVTPQRGMAQALKRDGLVLQVVSPLELMTPTGQA